MVGAAGFALVENAISLTIAAVVLTSLYGCFATGFAMVKSSRENTRATQILLTRLKSIRLSTFEQLTNTVYKPWSFIEYFDFRSDASRSNGILYIVAFAASMPIEGSLPESYRTNMMLVNVTLSWTSGQMQHTRTMQTYAARNGMSDFVSFGR